MIDPVTLHLAKQVVQESAARGLTVTTAESCTGGLVSAALTSVAGSSAVFTHGFVTYANEAKAELLGVRGEALATHGAVSQPIAAAMASGARAQSRADVAVSITGIAGPGGGSAEKPVGLVWFGMSTTSGTRTEKRVFANMDRQTVRLLSVRQALRMLIAGIRQHPVATQPPPGATLG